MDNKELLFKLVSIPSVNGTYGEIKIAEFIYNYLVKMKESINLSDDEFKVFFQDIEDDELGRKNVVCILRGRKVSNKAIVILGHFDTVDIEDYGRFKDIAFEPAKLKEKFKEIYGGIVDDDTEFGRGIFDMKAGIVVNIKILEELAKNTDKWGGYAIFLFVCDEEGDSKGMINTLHFLKKFKKEKDVEYLFCLDTDYATKKAVYLGSIGKILVGIFVKGVETHVGQSLEGINSNYILSCIISEIDNNMDLMEFSGSQFTSPPVTMKIRDLRERYNVKTNLYSFAYVNHLFFEKDLEQILESYKCVIEKVISKIVDKKKRILEKVGLDLKIEEIKVYYLEEFIKKYGKFIYKSYDIEDRREELVLSLKDWISGLRIDYPFVLLFFLPPYYPSVKASDRIRNYISEYVKVVKEDLEILDYFPYISDLSFLGGVSKVDFLKNNMLGWGDVYKIDTGLMNEVKMECMDWGVLGADAHKFTERVFVNYSLYKLPSLILGFIYKFLEK
ncbi:MAG: M20/M25/M40 family metallo-hydrolase [bacterium]